ncbi:MAG: GTPase ObgE [Dehalococcoidia bacterium]|nr:GTPase ObgE [Dehalococcoidia bacterium]
MIDKIEIVVRGGNGGDGLMSFRREKYIPFGGPDGGNGGNGGNVFIVTDSSLLDLSLLKQKREFIAESGHGGGKGSKHGKKGMDLSIPVPIGTMIYIRTESGEDKPLADMVISGEKVLVAKGGRGGLGNVHFATGANQVPRLAGKGELGEEYQIYLELKLVTDMCLIGYPNSGKSTLLSAITEARPRIADYPFTTRQPVLGVIRGSRRDFVVAEIPALTKGAYVNKGLGHEFLRHVERTKLLVYLLDSASPTIVEDFTRLNEELATYRPDLCQKAKIIAVNKVDMPQVKSRLRDMKQSLNHLDMPLLFISALDGQGITEFVTRAIEMVGLMSEGGQEVSPPVLTVFHPKPKK